MTINQIPTVNMLNSECIVSKQSILITTYIDICNGAEVVVPNGIIDICGGLLVLGFIIAAILILPVLLIAMYLESRK